VRPGAANESGDRDAATAVAGKRLTWDDIQHWPEETFKQELIDGRLAVSPVAGTPHGDANCYLSYHLTRHVLLRRLGRLFVAPTNVVLRPDLVLQPDLCFIRKDRTSILEASHIAGPPDLAIEILSPSNLRHDREVKFREYTRHGVVEYWIVDPEVRSIETFRIEGERYVPLGRAQDADRIVSRVFDRLELTAADVFPAPEASG